MPSRSTCSTREALVEIVGRLAPEVVVDEPTALASTYTPDTMARALDATDRLRTLGANLRRYGCRGSGG